MAAKLLREKADALLWFFDFDGSLCPHQEAWERRNYDAVAIAALMKHVQAKSRGIFWNTGRRSESLGSLEATLLDFPGYFVHGATRWDVAVRRDDRLGPELPAATAQALRDFVPKWPDFRLELKPQSLRVATTEAHSTPKLNEIEAHLLPLAPTGWSWVRSHRGFELLAAGYDKSLAIVRELPLRPGAVPVAVGDDVLDRPALEAALAAGGFAVLVGPYTAWKSELTPQSHVLHMPDPQAMLTLLKSLYP